jgi:hypothetical protein
MKHLDEATILAIRDGERVDAHTAAHVDECATCAALLAAARERADGIEHVLTALDHPIEATAAKVGVRARVSAGAEQRKSWTWGGRHLGRAAALLLLTAGAVAALPGSPLRTLLTLPVIGLSSEAPDPVTEPAPAGPVVRERSDVAIAVAVPEGDVQVAVRGADPGTEISVVWTEQASARLTAPAGSRFTYSAGRIEVDASRGALLIELPRAAAAVSLEVDGRLYLTGSAEEPEVLGPAVETTDDSILFRVVEP